MTRLTRDVLKQTDEEIEAAFDEQGSGLTVDDLTFVSDTIPDLLTAREQWNERGVIEEQTETLLVIDRAQPLRGQPRRKVIVIDFGAARAVDGAMK